MKKNKQIFTVSLTALLLSGTLLFTGCGSSADTDTNPAASAAGTDANTNSSNENAEDAKNDTEVSDSSDAEIAAGTVFSDLNTTDLDGNPIDSSVFLQNNLTLVNAWNVGCTPCVQELPALQKIHDEFAEKGVAIMGLYFNFGEELSENERAEISDVLADASVSYTQLRLSKEMYETDTMQQVFAFPSTFVVDSSGTIIDKIVGANSYEGWKNAVEEYLSNMFCAVEN